MNRSKKTWFSNEPRLAIDQIIPSFIVRKSLIDLDSGEFNSVSNISINLHRTQVTKQFTGNYFSRFPGLFNREIYWLLKMRNFDRTPNYLSHNRVNKTVKMTYVGEQLTKENLPEDYKDQIQYILYNLRMHNCSHNDIKPSELMCMDGKINIIDFSWSTVLGHPIPSRWPQELGDIRYRRGLHDFDDEYSLNRSIEYILNN